MRRLVEEYAEAEEAERDAGKQGQRQQQQHHKLSYTSRRPAWHTVACMQHSMSVLHAHLPSLCNSAGNSSCLVLATQLNNGEEGIHQRHLLVCLPVASCTAKQ
jgi:ArsR family metal-binding transcriptional regulator